MKQDLIPLSSRKLIQFPDIHPFLSFPEPSLNKKTLPLCCLKNVYVVMGKIGKYWEANTCFLNFLTLLSLFFTAAFY